MQNSLSAHKPGHSPVPGENKSQQPGHSPIPGAHSTYYYPNQEDECYITMAPSDTHAEINISGVDTTPEIDVVMAYAELSKLQTRELFIILWTKATHQPKYVKREWMELEFRLQPLFNEERLRPVQQS